MVHQMTVTAMPDFRADIEDLIGEGDKVVARLTFRGTHTGGEFMGIPPNGNSFAFSATRSSASPLARSSSTGAKRTGLPGYSSSARWDNC